MVLKPRLPGFSLDTHMIHMYFAECSDSVGRALDWGQKGCLRIIDGRSLCCVT